MPRAIPTEMSAAMRRPQVLRLREGGRAPVDMNGSSWLTSPPLPRPRPAPARRARCPIAARRPAPTGAP